MNYVYLLDPNDQEFRKIKAGALTQDGSALDGSVSRCPLWFEAMHEEISAPFLRRLIHPAILFLHICGHFYDFEHAREVARPVEIDDVDAPGGDPRTPLDIRVTCDWHPAICPVPLSRRRIALSKPTFPQTPARRFFRAGE